MRDRVLATIFFFQKYWYNFDSCIKINKSHFDFFKSFKNEYINVLYRCWKIKN